MKERVIFSAAVLGVMGVIGACSTPDIGNVNALDSDAGAECKRGDQAPCTCGDGGTSSKTCSSAGRYLECVCQPTEPKPAVCGDGTCDPSETCKDCPSDCGACPVCAEARSCTSGAAAPGQLKSTPSLDVKLEAMPKERILAGLVAAAERGDPGLVIISDALGTEPARSPVVAKLRAALAGQPALAGKLRRQVARPELTSAFARGRLVPVSVVSMPATPAPYQTMSGDAGALPDGGFGDGGDGGVPVVCDPARLRVRLAKIAVGTTESLFSGDNIYCALTSESPAATEGVQGNLTKPTESLNNGQSHTFGPEETIFWGVKEPKDAAGDLTLHYDCWEQNNPAQYEALVQKAAQLLANEYAYQEGSGWTSSVLDLAARYLPSLLSLDSDDHLFSVTQTIPRAAQLGLANGASWSVHKTGSGVGFRSVGDWDWTITVEAWGCVDNGYVQ